MLFEFTDLKSFFCWMWDFNFQSLFWAQFSNGEENHVTALRYQLFILESLLFLLITKSFCLKFLLKFFAESVFLALAHLSFRTEPCCLLFSLSCRSAVARLVMTWLPVSHPTLQQQIRRRPELGGRNVGKQVKSGHGVSDATIRARFTRAEGHVCCRGGKPPVKGGSSRANNGGANVSRAASRGRSA